MKSYNCVQTNDYRQIKMYNVKKMQWNIENILMITIKHLEIHQISALNNPYRVDMPLNK